MWPDLRVAVAPDRHRRASTAGSARMWWIGRELLVDQIADLVSIGLRLKEVNAQLREPSLPRPAG